jgi:hypothetical protein
MNDKYNITGGYLFDKYKNKNSKYDIYSLDDIMDKYSSYKMWSNNNDWVTSKVKKEETPEEKAARILREKAVEREIKIDKILKK